MATFNKEPAPQDFNWTTQWKNWLSRLQDKLAAFTSNVETESVQTDSLNVDGNVYVTGSVEIEEDLSAEDAAFSGELNVGGDITAGGFLLGENSRITYGPVTTTAVTAISLANTLPNWAGRVTGRLSGVSVSGTAELIVQLGTSAGLVTSGYTGGTTRVLAAAATTGAANTSGFRLTDTNVASAETKSVFYLELHDAPTNTWIISSVGSRDSGATYQGSGTITLPGVLTRVTLTTSNGTDTFDGGSASLRCDY